MRKQLKNNDPINMNTHICFSFSAIRAILMILIALISGIIPDLYGQRLSRDLNMDLLINQVGYVPDANKVMITKGLRTDKFEVINVETQAIMLEGNMKPDSSDFGNYSTADFSTVTKEGHYYIKCDTLRSYPFFISQNVYRHPMDLIISYFSLQRCGASATGFLTPCHLDDGLRMDNGKHQDVSGGWHDASDLRKWVGATILGMIGLAKTYDLQDKNSPNLIKIIDELKWGNLYFIKMQEPDGYVMNFVGGDVKKHSDSNRWTNNEIEEKGGELAFVKPSAGTSFQDMLIFGSSDDRVIQTDPAAMEAQYNFVTTEAMMARITEDADPKYSAKCLAAAVKCFNWCINSNKSVNAGIIGSSIQASIEMYKTTKNERYKDYAVKQAAELKILQVKKLESGIGGFFYNSVKDQEPYKNISRGCVEFISLCDLIAEFPTHQDASLWKEMISNYANQYLLFFSQKNSFGIIPFGLFSKEDPGGNRKIGNYWYRYFMNPELSWWVGINANISSAGVGLMKASVILNDPILSAVAQRQLDWILGLNPFNSSTIMTVGHNQPNIMVGREFKPNTPLIPGGVINGFGGDKNDQPFFINKNNFQQSEYWTPMVAYTLWLMAEISKID